MLTPPKHLSHATMLCGQFPAETPLRRRRRQFTHARFKGHIRPQPRMQRRVAGKVREQILHLVGQHAPRLQVDVVRVGERERRDNELDFRPLRRAPTLEIFAAPTCDHRVGLNVPAANSVI